MGESFSERAAPVADALEADAPDGANTATLQPASAAAEEINPRLFIFAIKILAEVNEWIFPAGRNAVNKKRSARRGKMS